MTTATLNKRRVYYANNRGRGGSWNFNCWGATLFTLGQAERLEWVDGYEMDNWLGANTIPIHRPRKPGDILEVRGGYYDSLSHTAVYLGNGRYFHKRGYSSSEITDLHGVRQIYRGAYRWRRMK